MLNIAEFGKNSKVTYWDGKEFFKGKVRRMSLNPITETVEYEVRYKKFSHSRDYIRVIATARNIKESKNFVGEK